MGTMLERIANMVRTSKAVQILFLLTAGLAVLQIGVVDVKNLAGSAGTVDKPFAEDWSIDERDSSGSITPGEGNTKKKKKKKKKKKTTTTTTDRVSRPPCDIGELRAARRSDVDTASEEEERRQKKKKKTTPEKKPSCAVLFFALPRSFKNYVLPSIIENVFVPNIDHDCDYFLHYHAVEFEGENRMNEKGGEIHGEDVYLLPEALRRVYHEHRRGNTTGSTGEDDTGPLFSIVSNTVHDFEVAHNDSLNRYINNRDLYYPSEIKAWTFPGSIINMVKQWHSIESVWKHMTETAARLGKTYDRVAMLRNDVMFVAPIDVFETPSLGRDGSNEMVVVPGWGGYPVNDRMVSGPHDAVEIWASRRFELIEDHVRSRAGSKTGMHSERFLAQTVFPAMTRETGHEIREHPLFCFVRVRADGTIRKDDCSKKSETLGGCDMKGEVQRILEGYHHDGDENDDDKTPIRCHPAPGMNGSIRCELPPG